MSEMKEGKTLDEWTPCIQTEQLLYSGGKLSVISSRSQYSMFSWIEKVDVHAEVEPKEIDGQPPEKPSAV